LSVTVAPQRQRLNEVGAVHEPNRRDMRVDHVKPSLLAVIAVLPAGSEQVTLR
jgi:hypothetical protein